MPVAPRSPSLGDPTATARIFGSRPTARVIGLQTNLTAPTRDHAGHVDLWFETRWESLTPDWNESFERLAADTVADGRAPATMVAAVLIGAERGYIVARGVRATMADAEPVAQLVRALVEQVNARPQPQAAQPKKRGRRRRVLRAFGLVFSS